MIKIGKKLLVVGLTTVVLVLGIGVNIGLPSKDSFLLPLSMDNIDALAAGESDAFNCYMYKDKCSFKVETEAKLGPINLLLKKLKLDAVELGATVDLTNATCVYSTTPNSTNVKVRCGTDVTCNALISSL
jgi:hypothetical protein